MIKAEKWSRETERHTTGSNLSFGCLSSELSHLDTVKFISMTRGTNKNATQVLLGWESLAAVGWQDSAGKGRKGWMWRWRGERRGSLVCFWVFSNPVATQFGVFLPLHFLALVCHSRKRDSKGQFPSRFNDPCDFFGEKCVLRGSSTCLPGPVSSRILGRDFSTIINATGDRRPG